MHRARIPSYSADPTFVTLRLLAVFGAGSLTTFIVYQIVKRDPRGIIRSSCPPQLNGVMADAFLFFFLAWGRTK